MKAENRQLIEFIGLLAVVLSLLMVAYEIRQSNNIAIVNSEFELRNNFTTINEAVLTEPELVEFLAKISTPGESLEGTDLIKAVSWTYRLMNIWLAAELAYNNGMSTEATYQNIFENIAHSMRDSSPEMRSVWRVSAESFPSLRDTQVMQRIAAELDKWPEAGRP